MHRRIIKAAVVIGALTVALKALAMGKEILVAAKFGTEDRVEACLIAFLLPSFIINVLGSSFSSASVPTLVRTRKQQGEAASQQLLSETVAFSGLVLVAATGLLAVLSPYLLPVLAAGFGPEKLALTQNLFYTYLPIIVLSGVLANWDAVLNARQQFAWSALVPMAVPVATIVLLVVGSAT